MITIYNIKNNNKFVCQKSDIHDIHKIFDMQKILNNNILIIFNYY